MTAVPPAIVERLDALTEAARDEGHVYGDPAGFKGNCEAAGKRTAAARARLVAAIADALQSRWQPIETAPKDGTNVLLYDAMTIRVGYYRTASPAGWRSLPAHWHLDMSTHWMPLLEPPR